MHDPMFPARRVPAQSEANKTAFAVMDSRFADQPFFGFCLFQDDRFLYANQRFADFCGRSPTEILALPSVLDVVAEEDVAEAREKIRVLLDGEAERVHLIVRVRRKDGTRVTLDAQGSRVLHEGRPAIVGVHCDIDSIYRRREQSFATLESPPRKQRMLVVDDDPSVRRAHARYVQELGYEPETAADGLEALTKLELGIDLVLLDLYMPSMDGFEVAARIRRHPTHNRVPIIMVTGSDREAWYPRALEIGCNAVLAKPINAEELRIHSRWLMELKAANDQLASTNERLTEAVERTTGSLRSALTRAIESERRVHQAHLDTIRRLTIAAEYKDDNIAGHLARVGLAAGILGEAAGLSTGRAETITHAAPLHDVGMIGIPDSILHKPGPLDDVERALVREHTHIGATLLAGSDSEVVQLGAMIALRHHEHWDGGGYPDGLVGDAIPIEARICAVVDYYDSSTMHRRYRRARPSEEVVAEIRAESGARFDPLLVDAFMAVLPEITLSREEFPIA